jgi:hypothetical protein
MLEQHPHLHRHCYLGLEMLMVYFLNLLLQTLNRPRQSRHFLQNFHHLDLYHRRHHQ